MRKTRHQSSPPSTNRRAVRNVGYGRPPEAHQFEPGQSGNPQGRPKGAKNEATILRALLNRKIDLREGGKMRRVSIMEAILLRFAEDALKGNTKSAAFLFNRYAGAQTGEPMPVDDLSANDREVLDEFVRRYSKTEKTR
jgi:hypothetical protein